MKIKKILKNEGNTNDIPIHDHYSFPGMAGSNDSGTAQESNFETEQDIHFRTSTQNEGPSDETISLDNSAEIQAEVQVLKEAEEKKIVNLNKNSIEQSRFIISLYSSILNSVCSVISGNENFKSLSEDEKEDLSKLFLEAYPEWQFSPKTTFWIAILTTTGTNIYSAFKQRKK